MSTISQSHAEKRHGGRPTLRDAHFGDYEGISALQLRNGLPSKSREDWVGLWSRNPVYREATGNWSIGSVLETEAGAIVGFIAKIPVAFHFRGRRLRGAVTGSWVTDPQYRGYSLQVLNSVAKRDNVELFITDTAGSRAEPALRALRWSKVPAGTWDKSFFWITNYRGFANAVLKCKSVPASPWIVYPASAALACLDYFRSAAMRIHPPSSNVDFCSNFDARFDRFWEDLKARKSDVLISARTRETLEWHFQTVLDQGKAWILSVSQGPRLTAYAVFSRLDSPRLGLERVRLIDFQALDSEAEALGSILSEMLRKCRTDGIHVLESTGGLLNPLGPPGAVAPYRRALDAWRYYYRATDAKLSNELNNAAAWEPSPYDGDTCL